MRARVWPTDCPLIGNANLYAAHRRVQCVLFVGFCRADREPRGGRKKADYARDKSQCAAKRGNNNDVLLGRNSESSWRIFGTLH